MYSDGSHPANETILQASVFSICLTDGGSAWVAYNVDQHQYLQVDLLEVHHVRKLDIQGGGRSCNCYTTTFKLLYSSDGLLWNFYESGRMQQGNSDRYRTVAMTFQPPITVRLGC